MFRHLFDFSDIGGYATIATIVCILAFVAIVVRTLLLKKAYITDMRNLPLDSHDEEDAQREE